MNHIAARADAEDSPQYDDPRHGGTEAEIRARVYPEPLILIPGLLTSGLTILAAGPKTGKSVLSQQIEHYLGAGIPMKAWPAPQVRHRVLVTDLEGNAEATQDTSLRLAPDAEDDRFSGIEYVYPDDLPARSGPALLTWLTERLTSARAAGHPYTYVRIDTLRMFLGSNDRRINAYEWDAQAVGALNQLGLGLGCAIVALHHLTKTSEESGDWVERLSGSMGVSGSATSIWLVERARGASTGVWRTTSRRLKESEHALTFEGGAWAFADKLTVDQAAHTGVPRRIVDYLTQHPTARWAELRELGEPGTVRKALTRLGHKRTIEQVDGVWSLVRQPEDPDLQPEPERPPATGWPEGSIGDEIRRATAARPHPARPGHDPEPEPEQDPHPEHARSALGTLKDAIGTVETRPCRPIPLIRVADRKDAPWTLAVQAKDGRHRWRHPGLDDMAPDRRVVVLDRRGSYPAAMSNVHVAPNKLLHTGPLPYDDRHAGIYLVEIPATGLDNDGTMGNVLGSGAEGAESLWLTAPSVRAMMRLGITPRILDSWTGRRTANLFEPYYRWVRETGRMLTEQEPPADAPEHPAWADQVAAFKRERSIAIRLLWPKSRESGLWRPDWHAAILAEANVRHWMVARRSGAELLAMANTDEAAFAVPDDAGDDWIPDGYVIGPALGNVSIKFRGTLAQWQTSRKRARRGEG